MEWLQFLPEVVAFVLLTPVGRAYNSIPPEVDTLVQTMLSDSPMDLRENAKRGVARVIAVVRLRNEFFVPGLIALCGCVVALAKEANRDILIVVIAATIIVFSIELKLLARINLQSLAKFKRHHVWLTTAFIGVCGICKLLVR